MDTTHGISATRVISLCVRLQEFAKGLVSTQSKRYQRLPQSCCLYCFLYILGGLPILLPHMFDYRGDHDELVQTFSLFKYISKHAPNLWQCLWFSLQWNFKSNPDKFMLISNPFSLPVKRPVASNFLMEMLQEFLSTEVRNFKAANWIHEGQKDKFVSLIEELFRLAPLPLFIIPELFRISEAGKAIYIYIYICLLTRSVRLLHQGLSHVIVKHGQLMLS